MKKVLVISDAHIEKLPDNTYWCRTAVHGYDFWTRYLRVFEKVIVVARVKAVSEIDKSLYNRADGIGVEIRELPFIRGMKGYLTNYSEMSKSISKLIGDEDCAIFRMPSIPAFMLLRHYKRTGKPYAFEIVADPMDAYSENKVAQFIFTRLLKRETVKANGVSYVTKYFLQGRYPSYSILHGKDSEHFDSYYSSINLDKSFFSEPRIFNEPLRTLNIIHVASAINSDIKGHTTLLKVIKELRDDNVKVNLTCVGDGDKRAYYEQMAIDFGIANNVKFTGLFSSKTDLREELLNSDLFVFPTKAEGLPRAVIEAMAVSLPCISTPVNGIPELLDSEYLFDPLDVTGISNKIKQLIDNPIELTKMSSQNYSTAKLYINSILEDRRNKFYGSLSSMIKENDDNE
ncbi:glycosyltransferase [Streptococcus suis]|uniref:Glycosyltransferase n=1 Tax=Streptococcus suis TaxID=1307 RepID=A0A3R8SAM6_STRSU|nr:glycosyltransferase [Streptococcus suis]